MTVWENPNITENNYVFREKYNDNCIIGNVICYFVTLQLYFPTPSQSGVCKIVHEV